MNNHLQDKIAEAEEKYKHVKGGKTKGNTTKAMIIEVVCYI